MGNMHIHIKYRCGRTIKSIFAFVRRRYKPILYYGAMALILALLASAAESYRSDREDAQPLVLTESIVQEAVAEAGEGNICPEGMSLIRGFSEQTQWNSALKQWEMHCANDYTFPDDAVRCLAGGKVTDVGKSAGKGGFVEIQGHDGRLYRYCSIVPEENILPGNEIETGAKLGSSDNSMLSETSEGKHLHLEVYENGVLTDYETVCGKNGRTAD